MSEPKHYLGDAVYLQLMPWGDIVLTTSDGLTDTNRIVLEPGVYEAMQRIVPHGLVCRRCGSKVARTEPE